MFTSGLEFEDVRGWLAKENQTLSTRRGFMCNYYLVAGYFVLTTCFKIYIELLPWKANSIPMLFSFPVPSSLFVFQRSLCYIFQVWDILFCKRNPQSCFRDLFCILKKYLFIYLAVAGLFFFLRWVLVAVRRVISCGMRAQYLQCAGLVAPRHVGS